VQCFVDHCLYFFFLLCHYITVSALLYFTASDYPFGIFKLDDNTVSEDDDNIDETLCGNVRPDNVTTKYSVTELHNVINEKHTNDGFLKEYGIFQR
jgi:hypothetical protein